jgi:hypothetical protein
MQVIGFEVTWPSGGTFWQVNPPGICARAPVTGTTITAPSASTIGKSASLFMISSHVERRSIELFGFYIIGAMKEIEQRQKVNTSLTGFCHNSATLSRLVH